MNALSLRVIRAHQELNNHYNAVKIPVNRKAEGQMDQSIETEDNAAEQTNPSGPVSDAKFIGWQEMNSGEAFAFYNITATNHPSFGSSVSEESLKKLGLQIPDAPLPKGFVRKL
jgi:hypothetical protein